MDLKTTDIYICRFNIVPVGAAARMSLLLSISGIACIWMAVGSFQSEASIFLRMTDYIR